MAYNPEEIAKAIEKARYNDKMSREYTYKSPIEQANALKEKNEDYYLSPEYEAEILARMKQARDFMNPRQEAANKEFNKALMAGKPLPKDPAILGIDSKTYQSLLHDYDNIFKGRYKKLSEKLGRKDYGDFTPYPNSIPINSKNPGGRPDVTGADRIYAMYQHALQNRLDFGKVLADDRRYFPDRTPNTLEFANDKFILSPGSTGGDHWRRVKPGENPDSRFGEIKDGWRHISAGTRYEDEIYDLLGKENFK